MKNLLLLLFALFCCMQLVFAQQYDSTKTYKITLHDDNQIIGHITSSDSINIVVKSLSGMISIIPVKEISEIKTISKKSIVENQYYQPDPADNRLIALPSGRALKQGEVQFNAMELIFPYLLFGATDYINIGFGGLPFVVSGGGTIIYYLTAKITPINMNEAALSFGSAIGGSTQGKEFIGAFYGVGTFGNRMHSVTMGMFYAFSKDEVFNRPLFAIGGESRISKTVSLISENIFLFGNDTEHFTAFPSFGIRFSGEKIAGDFATYAVIHKDNFFYPIPWIGISYKF